MIVLALIIILSILAYKIFIKPHYYWSQRGVKHNKVIPIFGNSFQTCTFQRSMTDQMLDVYKKYESERYVGWYQFLRPVLIIRDIHLLKRIAITDFEHFLDRPDFTSEDLDPLWANNMFANNGEKWRSLRAALTPIFTASKMKNMFGLVNECVQQCINNFQCQSEDVNTVEMKDICSRYTNDVIASVAFGVKCNSFVEDDNAFYKNNLIASDLGGLLILKVAIYQICPSLSKLLKLKLVNDSVANFFDKIIQETIKMREEQHLIRPDLIHLLLESRQRKKYDKNGKNANGYTETKDLEVGSKKSVLFSDAEIVAQAFLFLVAGFDTSSIFQTFIAYELAVNQDIQQRLREEISMIDSDCNENITYEDLTNMKYFDMVFNESQRKWAASPSLERICTKDYVIEPERPGEKRLLIHKGDHVWLNFFSIQRDPKYFPNPDRFDPERFSDENKAKNNPLASMTFGIGPRSCMGSRFTVMQLKIFFYHLLKNFQIVTVEKTVIPPVLCKRHLTMFVDGGMWLGLKKIK